MSVPGLIGNVEFQRQIGLLRFYSRYPRWQLRRRLLPGDAPFRLPTGLEVLLPRGNPFSTVVYVSDCNTDWGGERMLLQFLDSARDFLDVGANFGYYTLLAAPLVRMAYAFEPDPRNLPPLYRNASRIANARVIERAVAEVSGPGHLDVSRDQCVSRLTTRPTEAGISVDVVTLDDFAETEPDLDPAAIKIDVEGFDLRVIRGARGLIARSQPLIYFEFAIHRQDVDSLFAVVGSLDGYSIFGHLRPLKCPVDPVVLVEIPRDQVSRWMSKMLFLVPVRLLDEFRQLASEDVGNPRPMSV